MGMKTILSCFQLPANCSLTLTQDLGYLLNVLPLLLQFERLDINRYSVPLIPLIPQVGQVGRVGRAGIS